MELILSESKNLTDQMVHCLLNSLSLLNKQAVTSKMSSFWKRTSLKISSSCFENMTSGAIGVFFLMFIGLYVTVENVYLRVCAIFK